MNTPTPQAALVEALKPCPFCGQSHTLKVVSAEELANEGEEEPEPWPHSASWAVICDASRPGGPGGCGAQAGFKPSEAEAVANWNTRAALAQAEAAQPVAAELAEMEARKDAAYLERNRCVALVARMALALGRQAGIARTAIEGWSEDWHGCVYIDLPTGQASWHFHDSQAHLFAGLPLYAGAWDGHDTPTKYERVAEAYAAPQPAEAAPKQEALSEEAKFALIEQHLGLVRRRVDPQTVVDPSSGRWTDAARYLSLIDAALSAQPQQPAPEPVAPGWQSVPTEPTEDMLVAGQEAWVHATARRPAVEDCEQAEAVYRAMLAAAPQTPATPGAER